MRWETDNDRNTQTAIANAVAKRWQCRLYKLREYESIDYAALQDTNEPFPRLLAWVEVKGRKAKSDQYHTIMVSAHKWHHCICRAWTTNLPFHFVVGFLLDRRLLYYTYDHHHDIGTVWAGRTLRGMDDEDVEPVVLIPIQLFQDVSVIPLGMERQLI